MSERVAYLGGAPTAGHPDDGFLPYCIENEANASNVGANTGYPVGMTLDHLIELYWRWRKLRVDANVTLEFPSADEPYWTLVDTYNGSVERTTYVNGSAVHAQETDMVCPSDWSMSESTVTFLQVNVDIFKISFDRTVHVKKHGGLYYPSIWVGATMNGNYYVESTKRFGLEVAQPLNSTITMSDGTVYTITMYASLGTFTGSIDIDAEEYWAYAQTDGQAVYDTTTGAVIGGRDPFG